MRLGTSYDPGDSHAPWMAHWFPGYRREDIAVMTFQNIVAMHDFAHSNGPNGE